MWKEVIWNLTGEEDEDGTGEAVLVWRYQYMHSAGGVEGLLEFSKELGY